MLNPTHYEDLLKAALKEDLGNAGDVTSQHTIPSDAMATATMNARSEGVLAGLIPALTTFSLIDPSIEMTLHAEDGDILRVGQKLATIEGPAQAILEAERVALNLISHLSGIASMTAVYVHEVENTNAKVCDTRKTLPGLRTLQKYAVTCGGGHNHRFGLDDSILIKDNHIAIAGGIKPALDAIEGASHTLKIEIEVDNLEQLQEVIDHRANNKKSADIVMLDNFTIADLTKAVNMIDGQFITEASGGVTLETVKAIAKTGVDYISVGALTHSVKALDIGLDI